MHQPNLKNPRAVTRGSGLRRQRDQKYLGSNPAPSTSIKTNTNYLQQQQVRQLPHPHPAPIWLRSLLTAQKVSMVLFCSVFGLSSIMYGYTMQTKTTWRTQQDQLKRWESQGHQKGVMNEKLKQELAKKAAEQDSGLVAPKPEMAVFIPSAAPRQPKPVPVIPQSSKPAPVSQVPSGY